MNSKRYQNNRNNLVKLLSDASAIVIVGNGLIERSGDTNYTFKQDSSMLYFSGLKQPNSFLLVDCINNKSYIVLPKKTKIEQIFDDNYNILQVVRNTGVNDVISYNNALNFIKKLSSQGNVYTNLTTVTKINNLFNNPFKYYIQHKLKRHKIILKDASRAISELRAIKQPYEISAIKSAVSITKNVLSGLIPKVGQTEKDIEDIISSKFYKAHTVHGYEPIVAFGENSAVLHHVADSNCKYIKNQSVLYDVGAEYNDYCADISRTYPKDDFTLKVVEAVYDVQQQLIRWLAVGKTWQDFHKEAVKLLYQEANKLNLISKQEDINNLFPHSIGHYLGLEVHDVGDYKKPFTNNMVITVEPGLYSKKLGFGVRIEDDVLISNNGALVL